MNDFMITPNNMSLILFYFLQLNICGYFNVSHALAHGLIFFIALNHVE